MNNNNTGGLFRAKRNPFTQVSNAALRDGSLSLKAKGLYSLIQSYITIPNFTLYKGHLMSVCKEKEKAFNSAWKELKNNGYLKQYRIPKGKNDTFVYEYDLLDIADSSTPSLINLNKNGEEIKTNNENSELNNENSELNNENSELNNENSELKNGESKPKSEDSHTRRLVPDAKSTTCQGDTMPKAPSARRGVNNNTRGTNNKGDIKRYSNNIDTKKDFKEENFYNNTYTESSPTSMSTSDNAEKFSKKLSTKLSTETVEKADNTTKTIDNETNNETQQTKTLETKKELSSIPDAFRNTGPDESHKTNIKSYTYAYDFNTIEKIIQENISYKYFQQNGKDIELVNNFVACIVNTILTDDNTEITISNGRQKETKPISVIKSVLMKIKYEHVQHAIDQYKKQRHKITYKIPYMRNMLYNTYLELDAHYVNQVRVDGLVW